MAKRKLFLYLATAAGYLGIGMLLGYAFSDQTNNTPLWIGGLLVLASAILLGMFISARSEQRVTQDNRPVSSSGNVPDLPTKK